MILVFDTNVAVSALQFVARQGTPVRALEKAVNEGTIATCNEIDAELVRILIEKFNWNQPRVAAAMQRMLEDSIRVTIYGTVHLSATRTMTSFLNAQSAPAPT